MSENHDLRLAWQAHREGRAGRRDALLTLAVADAAARGEPWVGAIRDHLVASHPGHLFSGSHHLDEALADRRVIASLKQLRTSFPPARVRGLIRRDAVARGPYTGRKASDRVLLDELLAASRGRPRGPLKLGSAGHSPPAVARPSPPVPGPANPADEPIAAFYLKVLLGVAMLCALVVRESSDDKQAA